MRGQVRAPIRAPYLRRVAAIIFAAILLSGCYYTRAAYEEGRILWNRKPIDDALARDDLPADTRAKLQTVLAVRKFAAEQLGENVGGAYESIAPVDKGAIVHVVMAAPRDSLDPYTWWFPIVGRVPYRGYFNESEATAEASSLEAQGLDTMVRPAVAFSSLGFFDDPLLTNLLKLDRVELAGVIIHELFHRTYYLASDAMFDESAANYVGSAGAVAFFAATDGESAPSTIAARGILDSDLKFARFLLKEQARLLDIYMANLPKAELDHASRGCVCGDQGRLRRVGADAIGTRALRPRQAAAEQRGAGELHDLFSPARQLRRAPSDESRRLARDHRADHFDREGAHRRSFLRHLASYSVCSARHLRAVRLPARRQSRAPVPLRGRRRNDRRRRRSRAAPSRRSST